MDIVQFDHDVIAGTYGDWLVEWGYDCRILGPDTELPLNFEETDALLLLGGHMGVKDRQHYALLNEMHTLLPTLAEQGKPILAICLGAQLLADALGGRATSGTRGERSVKRIEVTGAGQDDPLFAGLESSFLSFQWHNDSFDLPAEATHLAYTEVCPGQAFRHRNAYGLQFHPEVNEKIVSGWCKRAKTDETPLTEFRNDRDAYQQVSRRILENFLKAI